MATARYRSSPSAAINGDPVDVLTDAYGRVVTTTDTGSAANVASNSAVTSVNDLNTVQTLLAANTSRKGVKIYNDSTVTLYVKLGTTATTSDYSFQIAPQGFYETSGSVYTGAITGIWSADASGAAKITELS